MYYGNLKEIIVNLSCTNFIIRDANIACKIPKLTQWIKYPYKTVDRYSDVLFYVKYLSEY